MLMNLRMNETGEYAVVDSNTGKFYCQALPIAPESREPELNSGFWLVLVFAVWNEPETKAIEVAMSAAEAVGRGFKLGIRPTGDHEEIMTWCPNVRRKYDFYDTPLWLVFHNGQLVEQYEGQLSKEMVINILRRMSPPDKPELLEKPADMPSMLLTDADTTSENAQRYA